MPDCLFCKILAGEVPSKEAFSTARTYAFDDINPVAPVHVLVISRLHIENAGEVRPEHAAIVAEMLTTAQSVAESRDIAGTGYRLVFNVGEHALNSVAHLHLHLLGGHQMGWPPG